MVLTWTLHNMDVMDGLALLPDNSVQVCVTSPPYFGLRDYQTGRWEGGDPSCPHKPSETPQSRGVASSTLEGGKGTTGHQQEGYRGTCRRCGARRVDRQIGLEASLQEYVDKLVAVFEEVRRVLRPDGVLFLNLGDSYAGSWGNYGARDGGQRPKMAEQFARPGYEATWRQNAPPTTRQEGLKPKDLMGVPWRAAFALQAAGWWLRTEIVWSKPNPMPESVKDRPTRSHEYVFLMTKSQRYYYDGEAIREARLSVDPRRPHGTNQSQLGRIPGSGTRDKQAALGKRTYEGFNTRWRSMQVEGRNSRTVWTLATQPYKGAHFATFPERLATRCILAGSSPKVCPKCGAGWERIVVREGGSIGMGSWTSHEDDLVVGRSRGTEAQGHTHDNYRRYTAGWRPTCSCEGNDGSGHALVLDPFAGSGTTLYVAEKYGRDSVGIELNPAYCDLARDRMRKVQVVMDYVGP